MKKEFHYVNEYRVELDYSVEENLKSFKEEVLNQLYKHHKESSVDTLLFSGGMDSSLILRGLQELGINPKLYTLSHSKDGMDHAPLLARARCKQFGAKEPEVLHIDKDDLFKHIDNLTYKEGIAYPTTGAYTMDYALSKMGDIKLFCGMSCEYRCYSDGIIKLHLGPPFLRATRPNRFYGFDSSETFLAFVNHPIFKANYLNPIPSIKPYGDNVWYIRDLIYSDAYPELGTPTKRDNDEMHILEHFNEVVLPKIKAMYPIPFLMKPWVFDAKEYHTKKEQQ